MRLDRRSVMSVATYLIPTAVAAGMSFWRLGTPSYWLDEAATLSAARRSVPDLLHLLRNADGVHGAYYLLTHFWIGLFGDSETAVRSLSAVALVAATPGLVLILSRLVGHNAAFVGGLAYAVSPTAAVFAATARSGAIVVAFTVWSTAALLVAVERGRIGRWALYVGAITLLGYFNLFALTILPAHLVLVVAGGRGDRTWTRSVAVRSWLVAVAVAGILVSPLVLLGYHQRGQISFLTTPNLNTVRDAIDLLSGRTYLTPLTVALAVVGLYAIPRSFRWFMVAWAVGPGAILLSVSVLHPVYKGNYILGSLPAVTGLAGVGLAWIAQRGRLPGRVLASGLAVVCVALALHQLSLVRVESFQHDDLRMAANCLAAHQAPGDAILEPDDVARWATQAYPDPYRGLMDLRLAPGGDPVTTGTLTGVDAADATVSSRIQSHDRIWLLFDQISTPRRLQLMAPWTQQLHSGGWQPQASCRFRGISEILLVRQATTAR